MNKYLKDFLHRGLMFGGFGPIITGIVYIILSQTLDNFSLGGNEVFLAIISTYILAFIHAGTSVFHQIEKWPMAKSLFLQLGLLYLAYTLCYMVNSWIPFDIKVLAIYTAIFVAAYLVIYLIVFLSVKATSNRINKNLN